MGSYRPPSSQQGSIHPRVPPWQCNRFLTAMSLSARSDFYLPVVCSASTGAVPVACSSIAAALSVVCPAGAAVTFLFTQLVLLQRLSFALLVLVHGLSFALLALVHCLPFALLAQLHCLPLKLPMMLLWAAYACLHAVRRYTNQMPSAVTGAGKASTSSQVMGTVSTLSRPGQARIS